MKSKEFEFYVKTDLSKYSGKYIVVIEDKVVVNGDNAKEVLEEAKKKFPDKIPTLVKIPKEEALILALKKEGLEHLYVDSGADIFLIPKSIGDLLDFNALKNQKVIFKY